MKPTLSKSKSSDISHFKNGILDSEIDAVIKELRKYKKNVKSATQFDLVKVARKRVRISNEKEKGGKSYGKNAKGNAEGEKAR